MNSWIYHIHINRIVLRYRDDGVELGTSVNVGDFVHHIDARSTVPASWEDQSGWVWRISDKRRSYSHPHSYLLCMHHSLPYRSSYPHIRFLINLTLPCPSMLAASLILYPNHQLWFLIPFKCSLPCCFISTFFWTTISISTFYNHMISFSYIWIIMHGRELTILFIN